MRVSRMTMFGAAVAVGGGLAGALLGGCATDLERQVVLLSQENEDLRQQLMDNSDDLSRIRGQLRDKDVQISDLQSVQIPLAQATGFEQIPGVTATVSEGQVTVSVDSDVLFDSGKTVLKTAAKGSLNSVVSVLNRSYGERSIRVDGHTDSDPIRRSGYKTNYHLGFERAWAVRKYLVDKGVDSGRIALASFGPDRPLGSKSASRRVDIVVLVQQ